MNPTIDDDIKLHEIYAHYWMNMAVTGACEKLKISHGTQGDEFTFIEKVHHCMDTAERHITLMRECIDHKKGMS